ncbi:MAG: DUF998 domain-containing protein [Candidatus Nanopelagicales bacterium]
MDSGQPTRSAADGTAWPSRRVSVTLILCALTNSAFLIWWLVGVRLSFSSSFVSELSADGEPGALTYRLFDLVTGVMLLAALDMLWNVFPRSRTVRVSQFALILFALLTIIDSALPLDCAPTADAICRQREELGLVTFAHQAHGVTGILESASLNIALLLLPLALWRNPGWRGFSKWSVALGSVYMIGNGVIAVQYIFGIEGLGITQRFQLLSFSVFLLVLDITQRRLFQARSGRSTAVAANQ